MASKKSTALSTVEANRLAELELVIKTGFVHALLAIAEIRDAKLWRGTHKSFETYARDHWQLSHTRLYQKLDEAAILGKFLEKGPTVLDLPENERQLQALAIATRGSPPEIVEARWREVQESTGKTQPTAKQIRLALAPERKNGTAHTPARARQQADPDEQQQDLSDLEKLLEDRDREITELEAQLAQARQQLTAIPALTRRHLTTISKMIDYVLIKVKITDEAQLDLVESGNLLSAFLKSPPS